jgi:hypothetical protein
VSEKLGNKTAPKYLFHGTSKMNPEVIYKNLEEGFDLRFSGENNMWGFGIYFAVNASLSDLKYKYTLPTGEFQMIYARVLVGKYHQC